MTEGIKNGHVALQPERGWPRFNDLLDPSFRKKGWFRPLGGKGALQAVCNEVQRFSRRVPWTEERESAVIHQINGVAFLYRYCQWLEAMVPGVSRTVARKGLQKALAACERLLELRRVYPLSWELARRYYPGESDEFDLSLSRLLHLKHAFAAVLRSDEFSRRTGRAHSLVDANLVLVLSTRELLGHFAGRLPGFSREAEASPGPLLRTIDGLYYYANDRRLPRSFLYRYIAQAQQVSQQKVSPRHYLLETHPSFWYFGQRNLQKTA